MGLQGAYTVYIMELDDGMHGCASEKSSPQDSCMEQELQRTPKAIFVCFVVLQPGTLHKKTNKKASSTTTHWVEFSVIELMPGTNPLMVPEQLLLGLLPAKESHLAMWHFY